MLTDGQKELVNLLKQTLPTASAEVAQANIDWYPQWEEGKIYSTGTRVSYDGVLYKCLQEHTAQEDWNPTDAPSLWAKELIPSPDVIPDWEQPDSTNPYQKGDKVTHGGKTWVSTINNNVWEPGEYGWAEVKEE